MKQDQTEKLMEELRNLWEESYTQWRQTYDRFLEGKFHAFDEAMQVVEKIFGIETE